MLDVTYPEVGATGGELPSGYRHVRAERIIGRGRDDYERACDDLLAGLVQKRAGVDIQLSDVPLREDTLVRMRLRIGPLVFHAPARVVWADRSARVCGFAYGTLQGHPERGEERFEVRIDDSGVVLFTIVAFSVPARWYSRLGGPIARIAQSRMTRRYLDALDPQRRTS